MIDDRAAADASALDRDRLLVVLGYGLYLVGVMGGLPMLAGVIIALVRKSHARGTIYESHYRNLILVFWVWMTVAFVAAAVTIAGLAGVAFTLLRSGTGFALYHSTLMLGLVFLGVVLTCFWYYWRLLRGFIRLLDDKTY